MRTWHTSDVAAFTYDDEASCLEDVRPRVRAPAGPRLPDIVPASPRKPYVIDPADTRAVISRALDALSQKRPDLPPRKHGNPPA